MSVSVKSRIHPFTKDLGDYLFPEGYKLIPGTSQIYELQLAVEESNALTPEELLTRGAYFHSINGKDTRHFEMCSVSPVQVDKESSNRRKAFFEANLFKTGYATHGLFPYRGKFHPQMIKAIMNIIGLKPGDTALDPMMGSGTLCTEASIGGIRSIGIDSSPFCVLMARAKTNSLGFGGSGVLELLENADSVFDHFDKSAPDQVLFYVNEDCKDGPVKADRLFEDEDLEEFVLLAYLDAMGYARRRKNKTPRELFPVVLSRYVSAAATFAETRQRIGIEIEPAEHKVGDARDLTDIDDDSVDGVVTSPPYSFAIDYVMNDAPQLEYMGIDLDDLRKDMIGLRGTKKEQLDNYLEDMNRVMGEIYRVLKTGKFAVVVIGTNSNQIKRLTGRDTDVMLDKELTALAEGTGFQLVSDVIHPIEGIRNTLRDEHLLFYMK